MRKNPAPLKGKGNIQSLPDRSDGAAQLLLQVAQQLLKLGDLLIRAADTSAFLGGSSSRGTGAPEIISWRWPDSESLNQFLTECIELDPKACIQARVLFKLFSAWAKSHGMPECTETAFGRALTLFGVRSRRSNVIWRLGIRPRKSAAEDDYEATAPPAPFVERPAPKEQSAKVAPTKTAPPPGAQGRPSARPSSRPPRGVPPSAAGAVEAPAAAKRASGNSGRQRPPVRSRQRKRR